MNSSCSLLIPSKPGHGSACAGSPSCLKTFSRFFTWPSVWRRCDLKPASSSRSFVSEASRGRVFVSDFST